MDEALGRSWTGLIICGNTSRGQNVTGAANEFIAKVQCARKGIFRRYLIWFLCCFAGVGVVWWFVQPFSEGFDGMVMAIWFICGILLLWAPIRKLQKMPCPYCGFAARVGASPFRHFRCMCCHRSIGESMGQNREAEKHDALQRELEDTSPGPISQITPRQRALWRVAAKKNTLSQLDINVED